MRILYWYDAARKGRTLDMSPEELTVADKALSEFNRLQCEEKKYQKISDRLSILGYVSSAVACVAGSGLAANAYYNYQHDAKASIIAGFTTAIAGLVSGISWYGSSYYRNKAKTAKYQCKPAFMYGVANTYQHTLFGEDNGKRDNFIYNSSCDESCNEENGSMKKNLDKQRAVKDYLHERHVYKPLISYKPLTSTDEKASECL